MLFRKCGGHFSLISIILSIYRSHTTIDSVLLINIKKAVLEIIISIKIFRNVPDVMNVQIIIRYFCYSEIHPYVSY